MKATSSLILTLLALVSLSVACNTDEPAKDSDDLDGDGIPASEDCDDNDPDMGAPADWYRDLDHDLYGDPDTLMSGCNHHEDAITVGGDCDDTNPEVNPGKEEACNGLDDDCNGYVDDRRWYADADLDGYGDPSAVKVSCLPPPDLISDNTDCDDTNPRIHPQADETCDDIDQDCDGLIDEDPVNPKTWYLDADSDLYGDPAISAVGCDPPDGYVFDNRDCNDSDEYIRPYGREYVGDGIDSDCSGGESCYMDLDEDGFGGLEPRESADMDCDDPGEVADHSDCNDWSASIFPDATEYCNGSDDDCDGEIDEDDAVDKSIWYQDSDRDRHGNLEVTTLSCDQPRGYTTTTDDCDDTNNTVYPGAPELCDALDNNCDEIVDDVPWYFDGDSDTYGDPENIFIGCPMPEGYVENALDCDDTTTAIQPGAPEIMLDGIDQDCDGGDTCYEDSDQDSYGSTVHLASEDLDCDDAGESRLNTDCDDDSSAVYPGATELCNDIDDDCDDRTDEGSPADAPEWHPDLDHDGYGDIDAVVWACDAPLFHISDASDCDDTRASVNPEGEELCNGYDDDCNGLTDNVTWYRDQDADGYGQTADSVVSCPGPDGWAMEPDDCDDDNPEINPGAEEICGDSIDNDCNDRSWGCGIWGDVDLTEADATFVGSLSCTSYDVGLNVAGAGDLNLDGFDDILLGLNANGCTSDPGQAYVFYGPVEGEQDLSSADLVFSGTDNGDQAGAAVAAAGDVDHNGYPDILIGAYGEDTGGGWGGMAYLFLGPISGSADVSEADASFYGPLARAWVGWSLDGAGDVNDDGYDDIILGSPSMSMEAHWRGAAYLELGPVTGSIDVTDSDAIFLGEAAEDMAGWAVAGAGDVDGDGRADILVGALRNDGDGSHLGAAYLVLSPDSDLDLSASDAIFYGAVDGDAAGSSVDGAQDVNGDGYDDLLIGAHYHDLGGYESGAAHLVLGPVTGTLSLSAADATLYGERTGDYAGGKVSGVGDIDNDGCSDLLVGAARADGTGTDSGAAYLVMGPVSGSLSLSTAGARLYGPEADTSAGTSLAGAGDVDGNGFGDILIGASPSTGGIGWLLYNEAIP